MIKKLQTGINVLIPVCNKKVHCYGFTGLVLQTKYYSGLSFMN